MLLWKVLSNIFLWVFGVGTCAYYAIETIYTCSQSTYLVVFFLPLFIIPIANVLMLVTRQKTQPGTTQLAILGTLNGLSVLVSSLLLLVLSPLCLLAMVGAAIGMMMLFSDPRLFLACFYYFFVAVGPCMTSVAMRVKLRRFLKPGEKGPWLGTGVCTAAVLASMLVALFPTALTQSCQAAIIQGRQAKEGLLLLRAAGDEDEMLRACYRESSALPWFFMGNAYREFDYSGKSTNDAYRQIYYRVKGKPFNTAPRPLGTRPDYYSDYSYYRYLDYYSSDFAGDAVGGVVAGLGMSGSSIKGWVDANEAVAHMQWRMHFHNELTRGTELRTQILLPPRAVVSGCSLWVNGKKREAIFATRQSSREAYVSSANKGEKPLLVSTAGAGRVLLQSSTGWWGKDADLEVEITAPLKVLNNNEAAIPLPMLTERNFSVNVAHNISLSSQTPMVTSNSPLITATGSAGSTTISGNLPNNVLGNGVSITLSRDPKAVEQIAIDPTSPSEVVVQKIGSDVSGSATRPVAIVVDGSSSMSSALPQICDALENIQLNKASIIWVSDKPIKVVENISTSSPEWKNAVARLRDSSCLGGQDNAEALAFALKNYASAEGTAIVWMHGPQPVAFNDFKLWTLLTLKENNTKLYEFQVAAGPNEVVKSLNKTSTLIQIPRITSIKTDLTELFSQLSGKEPQFEISRDRVHKDLLQANSKHPLELSQLHFADLIFSNLDDEAKLTKYGAEGEKHHIVTPLTSAVILENQPEIDSLTRDSAPDSNASQAKTTPSSPTSPALAGLGNISTGLIPATPEPPMEQIMLCVLMIGSAVVWIKRRRKASA
jgi:hypothetical protein